MPGRIPADSLHLISCEVPQCSYDKAGSLSATIDNALPIDLNSIFCKFD